MRPVRTLLVGIIAFALGIVGTITFPVIATGKVAPQQKSPFVVDKGPGGPVFRNVSKNPLLVVGTGDQQKDGFTVVRGSLTLPAGKSTYVIYEAIGKYEVQNGDLGEIGPCLPDCAPPPPPCATPPCPPAHMWKFPPALSGNR